MYKLPDININLTKTLTISARYLDKIQMCLNNVHCYESVKNIWEC